MDFRQFAIENVRKQFGVVLPPTTPPSCGWASNTPHMETLERGGNDAMELQEANDDLAIYLDHLDNVPNIFFIGRNPS